MPQKKLIRKIFVIVVIILLFGVYSYKHSISTPFDKGNMKNISFVIKKGESVKNTCKNLENDNLIKNSTFFCLFLKLNDLDKNIIAGRFILNQSLTPKEIAEKITNIQLSEAILTIQEGLTIKDIDKKLIEMNLISEGEFISAVKNFDGYKYYNFLNPKIL
ncbi:MAG: endolytic transglycosylase MltG, partial [Candidatus Gracilibacteria bacterium]